ncbi:MAG: thioredoxin TrxC [Campylobacteraceae bacterium]|nr:thioredoxin TrxC [Campylobacteraceae bacterium]
MRIICPSCTAVNNIPKKETYKKANCGKCKNSLLEKNLINLTNSNFDEVIVNSDIPVIVDFWAPWCGPCKVMGPIFEKVSSQYILKSLFTKVDTEAEQNLGAKYAIRSIPTLIVFKDGIEVERVSGALDEGSLKSLVNKYLIPN